MSDAQTKDNPIHRLIDMVVEEVSLVDRAANEHRFLIVKRSDPVNPDADSAPEATAEDATAETDTNKDAHTAPDVMTAAVAALEGLTEAVEILNADGGDQARLAELASELQGLASKLAGEEPAVEPAAPPADEASTPDTTEAVDAIRATLSRVGELVDAATAAAAAKPAEPANEPEPDAAPDAAPAAAQDNAVTEHLAAVAKALRDLTTTVQTQHQRIAQVEKRFGMPNSARSDERPKPNPAPVTGWPMDMNNPMDRESVDKSVSFHDL